MDVLQLCSLADLCEELYEINIIPAEEIPQAMIQIRAVDEYK